MGLPIVPFPKVVVSSESPKLTNTTKHDLSETSFDGANKMGEGRDGPSHCPVPKVVI